MSAHEAERRVARQHAAALLAREHVVAVGVGFKRVAGRAIDTPCLVCSVDEKLPLTSLARSDRVPAELDGVPTDVWGTGVVRALQSRTDRLRPAPGGVSIGHSAITAGTLGCVVRRDGQRVILSNNHVLANSNDAREGDAILQPGPLDGGRLDPDTIATLRDFVPIRFAGDLSDCPFAGGAALALNGLGGLLGSRTRLAAVRPSGEANRVDAAIAEPRDGGDVDDAIFEIGEVTGTARADLGTAVQKSGRTTGFTRGEVLQVDVTVDVQYGFRRIARFEDQLLAGPMSQGGDSGSAVLDSERRLVGLLFAGSQTTTILNRIEHVFEALSLEL